MAQINTDYFLNLFIRVICEVRILIIGPIFWDVRLDFFH
jgi:hypothetical protein